MTELNGPYRTRTDDPATSPQGYGTPPQGYGAVQPYGGAELASWGLRVGAALLDALVGIGILLGSGIVGAILGTVSSALAYLFLALGYLGALGFFVYNLVRQGRTGATYGKGWVGIRLLREFDGQPVGVGVSIGRAFLHVVDSIPLYLGYLWPLWDSKKQTFADKIVSTVVIRG